MIGKDFVLIRIYDNTCMGEIYKNNWQIKIVADSRNISSIGNNQVAPIFSFFIISSLISCSEAADSELMS